MSEKEWYDYKRKKYETILKALQGREVEKKWK